MKHIEYYAIATLYVVNGLIHLYEGNISAMFGFFCAAIMTLCVIEVKKRQE